MYGNLIEDVTAIKAAVKALSEINGTIAEMVKKANHK